MRYIKKGVCVSLSLSFSLSRIWHLKILNIIIFQCFKTEKKHPIHILTGFIHKYQNCWWIIFRCKLVNRNTPPPPNDPFPRGLASSRRAWLPPPSPPPPPPLHPLPRCQSLTLATRSAGHYRRGAACSAGARALCSVGGVTPSEKERNEVSLLASWGRPFPQCGIQVFDS